MGPKPNQGPHPVGVKAVFLKRVFLKGPDHRICKVMILGLDRI
jgi:hypothetical protein